MDEQGTMDEDSLSLEYFGIKFLENEHIPNYVIEEFEKRVNELYNSSSKENLKKIYFLKDDIDPFTKEGFIELLDLPIDISSYSVYLEDTDYLNIVKSITNIAPTDLLTFVVLNVVGKNIEKLDTESILLYNSMLQEDVSIEDVDISLHPLYKVLKVVIPWESGEQEYSEKETNEDLRLMTFLLNVNV